MKTAKSRSQKNLRPKHKQTKEYLKHYYPFIPLFVSIGFLLVVLLSPIKPHKQNVLAASTNISPTSLLQDTNTQRINAGDSPLSLNNQLSIAAQAKAQDMVARNYWSHKTPDGLDPWNFISKQNYNYKKAGENLAYGFTDSSSVVTGWMNSPSHRRNLLDNNFEDVGFGIAESKNFNNSGSSIVVVALYAKPMAINTSATNTEIGNSHILGNEMTIRNANFFINSPWSVYLIGAIIGASLMYLSVTHGVGVRKKLKRGEKFVIKHPLLDSAVVSLIAIGILLLQTVGIIL